VVELALLFFNRQPIITHHDKGKEIMKITLEHNEIDQALIDFVRKQGLNVKAGDIQITVKDGQISAALATTFLTAAAVPTETVSVPTAEVPQFGSPVVEEDDREVLKAELDKLGIEYAPKARTATLQSLLEEAQASHKEPAPTIPKEDTSALFGESAAATVSSEDPPPFEVGTLATPVAPITATEEIDDDKPLFGV